MNQRKPYPQTVKAVCYLYFWCHPEINWSARQILAEWPTHPVLADYRQPDKDVLTVWIEEFVSERNSLLYGDRYKKV